MRTNLIVSARITPAPARLGEPLPGINDRAIFIVDKQGKIAFSKTYELGQEPDYDELVTEVGKIK